LFSSKAGVQHGLEEQLSGSNYGKVVKLTTSIFDKNPF